MPFLERLQSAMILKTPMYQQSEADIVEHLHEPFYKAIIHEDIESLDKMIYEGFDIDFYDAAHSAPLIYSIINDKISMTEYLLKKGADANITTLDEKSALHVSISIKHYDAIELLLKYGADPLTCKECDKKTKSLIKDTKVIVDGTLSAFEHAKKGDLASLAYICMRDKKLLFKTQDGYSLLHLATYGLHRDIIIYLLNKGLNIDTLDDSSNTALIVACKFKNSLDIVSLLIDRDATLDHKNTQSDTALTLAIKNSNAAVAHLLIDSGANIHVSDSLNTPLTLIHEAIFRNSSSHSIDQLRSIESKLLIKGAHVDIIINDLGWTPLYTSISRVQTLILKLHSELLIHLGADINHIDKNGRTVLMIAASLGRYEAIKLLIDNYAKIDILDKFGWSALMLGVYYNHYDVVELLLIYEADVNLSSSENLNALKIATQHKRDKMISLLLQYGATKEKNKE
jgi:ankyrin repeat protein